MKKMDWLTKAGLACLATIVVVSVVGTVFSLGGRPEATVGPRLAPPGGEWLLGTDQLGRSLLPRLFEGVVTTLLLSSIAVLVTAVLATLLGLAAGYWGGWVGEIVLRLVEMLYSFPTIVLAILVAAVIGPGVTATACSTILITIPLMTRLVRAAAATVSQRDYVTSAVISGAGWPRILFRHVLPNISGTIAVQGTYALSMGILVEGGLSYLGFGVQPPQSSLGALIQQGSPYLLAAPWLVISPGVVIIVAILSINVFGDGLRDSLEPRKARSLT